MMYEILTDIEEKEVLLKELVVNMLDGEENPNCEYLAFLFNEINQEKLD